MATEDQPVQLCSNCKYGITLSTMGSSTGIRQCFVDPPTMVGSAPTRPRVNDYEFCSRWWPEDTPIPVLPEELRIFTVEPPDYIQDYIQVSHQGFSQDPQEQANDEDESTAREADERTVQAQDGPPNRRAQRIGKPPHHRPRP